MSKEIVKNPIKTLINRRDELVSKDLIELEKYDNINSLLKELKEETDKFKKMSKEDRKK